MTTKKIYYYTLTGKTEALIEDILIEKVKLNSIDPQEFQFGDEEIIILGTPTYGRGTPPKYFKDILKQLRELKSRKIILFGSGNTIYNEDYCGALDVLEEVLKNKNIVLHKFKFEGYPTQLNKEHFLHMLNEVLE